MSEFVFYQCNNKIKPHCLKCNINYNKEDEVKLCREFYGKGKQRRQCGGEVMEDLFIDWSDNLLKDYSIITKGDTSIYDECWKMIDQKLSVVKNSTDPETSRKRVNVQKEIEQYMRKLGVNLFNYTLSDGTLVSQSRYLIKSGLNKITQFAYDDLRGRFEERELKDKDGKVIATEGYMTFKTMKENEELKPDKEETVKKSDLVCEVCHKECKSSFGLMAHLKSHEKELTKNTQ
jgi:hypothetical protein